ncbi:hypothetical protein MTR67_020860 [Solanum verrucosum]|uniref:non-specific serine/threonine protein kinase n=1 Tax=Solanum verrucosum TaxID=315347 RepID=A0AAF0TVA4_SOLVR|nr:hypothetical protein MTR67_020860 [Solanum verrucosum]
MDGVCCSDSSKVLAHPCWIILKDSTFGGFEVRFSKENILGAGGYGMVYYGNLINGTLVDINKFLNNLCQLEFEFKIFVPEKEFQVEVEAIGHHHHKMLVYEYVNNGNLEQWLHGAMRHHMCLTWKARMKVSDFGLAKLLGAGKSHITTRVNLWKFALLCHFTLFQIFDSYVAPKYANIGLLNEKNNIYSFGGSVVRIDHTRRDHVDYGRPAQEVCYPSYLILRSN